ncbi:Peroxisomal membrane 22 kDa Mpv17/PMP22 family protein [Prunus dulcis]|uniref:Peroxisomal membrane 22 kDa Mpv17/PMP22 family protein n=1 Tax=Prunus dulcis TaxID=3755 RepID=A0A4Y1QKY1_PRUDU|nr:Peroxisomal membrane 22 kDa Mpv17/PMP22 family protein [Prunus dulcis]
MSEIVNEAWRKYLIQLQSHPLRTKAITSGVLAGCSDAIAQKISGIKKLQLRRLLLIMLYGFGYGGPFGHFLHKLMDIIFKGKKDNKTIAKKVLLEQLTSSPWNNMLFMMYYGLVVEGRPWNLVKSKVRKDYPSIQLTAWKFWPIVGWVNYQYMPLQFRVLFHSFVASCWAIFLNLKARSGKINNVSVDFVTSYFLTLRFQNLQRHLIKFRFTWNGQRKKEIVTMSFRSWIEHLSSNN